MENQFGSDFITIEDCDGVEYELEVSRTLEYNGATYLVTMPTSEELEPEILFFRVEDDPEDSLCFVEDEEELNALNELLMQTFYEEDEE